MPCDITELVLCVRSMGGDWHRLRNEVGKRGLAVLDRNSVGLWSGLLILALLGQLGRRAGSEACRRGDVVRNNEVVDVHGLRRGNVLFRILPQLSDAAGPGSGLCRSTGSAEQRKRISFIPAQRIVKSKERERGRIGST